MAERTLPMAAWTQRADLAQMVAALGPDNVRWVGGAVRDTLLGADVQDVDAATTLKPGQVIEALEGAGIRTIPTGIDHGTVTAIMAGGNVEITTLRHDVETDGRHARVQFAQDWREDAARRDFTINALYAHPVSLDVFDWFGGLEDLAARRVRFIGDARQRICEDYLRILRYFRFAARFGGQLDDEAEEACAQLAGSLGELSRERVGGELRNLLALPDPVDTVVRMKALGVLSVVLPEAGRAELERLRELVATERQHGIEPDEIRRLAALLPAVATLAEATASRLRLSRRTGERLACVAARKPSDAEAPRALAYREGLECARDRLLLGGHGLSALDGWTPPDFPLKGGEVIARGVVAGPRVSRVMQAVEDRWIAEDFPARDRVLAMLDEHLAQQ